MLNKRSAWISTSKSKGIHGEFKKYEFWFTKDTNLKRCRGNEKNEIILSFNFLNVVFVDARIYLHLTMQNRWE